jgi:prepilin-type N-terminal cleavage/methylation domain-containing protein/prepilin-type processing-associated H-X9-DG protein
MVRARTALRPHGFTLVELLVVIAIIGVLIALVLPAVQAAHEAARKSSCANNLHQIGLALHSHLASHKTLPPGYVSLVLPNLDDGGPGWGWGAKILPEMEQGALFQKLDFSLPIDGPAAALWRMTSVPSFICPSDAEFAPTIDVPKVGTFEVACKIAAASYVGSAGTVRPSCKVCRDLFDGVFGRNRAIKAADITDGLSNTIAVGERSNYWASAAIWGVVPQTVLPDRQQPGRYAAAPAYVLGTTFKDGFNIESALDMDHNSMGTYAESFYSLHPSGAYFVFADGSVHFIREDIDKQAMNNLATRDQVGKDGRIDNPVIHESPF